MSEHKNNSPKPAQNGKGMRPKIGYDIKKWDVNYDKIFKKNIKKD